MKAVILAGGFGTRIQPLTNAYPKPMLPIVNKPMMEHTMVKLRDLGIRDFIVLLYFKPEIIKSYFGDGSAWGMHITYILPDDDYGTAGAVKCAQDAIGEESFIIVSGDLVTDFNFQAIIDHHTKRGSKLTITLTSVVNPLQFGVVIADDEGHIEKFLEKPSWGEVFSDTINTGIYVIEPEILEYIPKNSTFDFAKDLFPLLMRKNIPLLGYTVEGYWRDVGNPDSYREVYDDILNDRLFFSFSGTRTSTPNGLLYSHESYTFEPGVEILDKVILGKNVTIGRGVKLQNAVIGDHVVIGEYTKIRNSVVWDHALIGKGVSLDYSVICNHTHVGNYTQAKAGLILAEGSEIGSLVSIEKDITIWPHKIIADASIVSTNVIWGSKYKNSIFENGSVVGISNIELSCEMSSKLAEAFASQLPVGSKIYISRDHVKSSRMLKRAFLGGVLASGVSVIDVHALPSSIMRYNLAAHKDAVAGVHFRQSIGDPSSVEIVFFNEHGLKINSSYAKNIEKAFFKEEFRRVNYQEIGEIIETRQNPYEYLVYEEAVLASINQEVLTKKPFHMVLNLMSGDSEGVFPKILNELKIGNIVLNAYVDERKLSHFLGLEKRAQQEVCAIVNSLDSNMGYIIYPNGKKVTLITDKGELLEKETALLVMLYLVNLEHRQTPKKVLLPAWAPDIMDGYFKNIVIERGKYAEYSAQKLREYDLIATLDGNFAFTEFALHHDSIYTALKTIEMLLIHDIALSTIVEHIDPFYYRYFKVPCKQSQKGMMMRKFLEESKGKKSSTFDGVKIWTDTHNWILMIPHQYEDALNLYIQAKDAKEGEALYDVYQAKIEAWAQL